MESPSFFVTDHNFAAIFPHVPEMKSTSRSGVWHDGFRGMAQVDLKMRIPPASTTIDIYMLGKILHFLGGLSLL